MGKADLQFSVKTLEIEHTGLSREVYLYAMIDTHSRYKVGIILPEMGRDSVDEALRTLLLKLPARLKQCLGTIQVNNRPEFAHLPELLPKLCKEMELPRACCKFSDASHQNLVISASFKADENEFFWKIGKAKNLTELNAWYDEWMDEYNVFRPHQQLDNYTPTEALAFADRTHPLDWPLDRKSFSRDAANRAHYATSAI